MNLRLTLKTQMLMKALKNWLQGGGTMIDGAMIDVAMIDVVTVTDCPVLIVVTIIMQIEGRGIG